MSLRPVVIILSNIPKFVSIMYAYVKILPQLNVESENGQDHVYHVYVQQIISYKEFF